MQKLILVQSDSILNDQFPRDGVSRATKLARRLSPLLLEKTTRLVLIEGCHPEEIFNHFAESIGVDDIVSMTSISDGFNQQTTRTSKLLVDIGSSVDFLIAFAAKRIIDGVSSDFITEILNETDYQPAVGLGDGIVVVDCRQGYRTSKAKKP